MSNSYLTISEAQTILDQRLNTDAWDTATSINKNKALVVASERIDALGFAGSITVAGQEHEFPRDGEVVVPAPINTACALIALALLSGEDTDTAIRETRVTGEQFDKLKRTYDTKVKLYHLENGIPSYEAWLLLKPFLAGSEQTITYTRVS